MAVFLAILFFFFFFFLMIRRPPRSTLFPTRRSPDLDLVLLDPPYGTPNAEVEGVLGALAASRSEEHTSELQSLTNLVCRLLLEKKKKISYPLLTIKSKTIHKKK